MPIRTQSNKKTSKKKSVNTTSAAAAISSGALPPYGVPIRDAISRADPAEMRELAVATRKYLMNVQSALEKLERALR